MKKILLLISLFIILLPCVALADGAEASYGYVDGNTVYAGISLDNPQSGSNVYVGIYTSEGKLKSLKSYPVTSTSYSIDMKIDGYSSETGDVIRMFCLGDDIAPLAETVSHNMKSLRLSGIITGTSVIGQAVATDEVEFMCTYAGGDPAWELIVENASNVIIKHGIANINDYFGACVDVYVDEIKENLYKITGISFDEDYSIVDLEKGSIDTLTSSELNYYESDTAVKTTCLNLDDADVYVNNEYSDINDIQSLGDDTEIRLIENTGDGKYDLIIAKEYKYGIIDTVEPDRSRILTRDGYKISFDFEDDTVSNCLINRGGGAVTLEGFESGDVIAYISDENLRVGFSWIEIINLGNNCVSGRVTEIQYDSVFIDGNKYELSSSCTSPRVGESITCYLTKNNKVFTCEIDMSHAYNYGYILDMGMSFSAFLQGWQFKILTKEGNIEIYDGADMISVDNETDYTSAYVDSATASWSDFGFLANLEDKNFNELPQNRLVTYKLNSSGEIRQISSCNYLEFADADYDANALVIDNKILADEVIVFDITASSVNGVYTADINSLVHDNSYSGIMIPDDYDEYNCVVITSGQCDYDRPEPTYSEPVYGYAYTSGIASNTFDYRWQLKVLSEAYPNLSLDFADSFTVNGVSYSNSDYSIPVLEDLNSDVYSGEERIVSYVLENGKYISELDFVPAVSFTDAVYSTDKLGDAVLSDKTKVYDIYGEVMLTNAFMAGETYSGCAIVDSNGAYTHVFVTSGDLDYTDITLTPKYGYILEMAQSESAFSIEWQFKILTQDGDIIIYDSRDSIVLSSEVGSDGYSVVYTPTADWEDIGFLAGLEGKSFNEDAASRIVLYTALNNGEITRIESLSSASVDGAEYDAASSTLGNNMLADDIVVFDVSAYSTDYATVTNLIDKAEYKGWLAQNADGENAVMAYTECLIFMDFYQDVAIVDSVNTIIYNDDYAWRVRYYSGNDEALKEIILTYDTSPMYSSSIYEIAESLNKGSMLMFVDDGNGVAVAATLISTANYYVDNTSAAYTLNDEAVAAINAEGDLELVAGYISNIHSSTQGVNITCGDGYVLPIKNGVTNTYTYYNVTYSKQNICVGDWMGASTIDVYDPDTGEATYFIAIVENGVVSDFMTYSTRKLVDSGNLNAVKSDNVIDTTQDLTVIDEVKSITENTEDAFEVKYYTEDMDTSLEVSSVSGIDFCKGDVFTLPEKTPEKKATVIE